MDNMVIHPAAPQLPWKVGMSFNAAKPLDFQAMKAAGIDCIELNCRTLDIRKPEVKARCERWITEARGFGIDVWSYHLPYSFGWDPSVLAEEGRKEAILNVSYVIELCAQWDISTLVYHPSYEPIPPEHREERLALCKQTLHELACHASAKARRIAVECLPRTCLGNTADEIAYLLEGNDELMVCCDVNHLFREAPETFIRQLGSRIATTHISDHDGLDEKHWLPGSGRIQWSAVIDALRAIQYKGPFMYEVRDQTIDQVAANWRQLLSQQASR